MGVSAGCWYVHLLSLAGGLSQLLAPTFLETVSNSVILMPKVSVVIPCYNQGPYVVEAIDSVLAQSFEDFEIVVVNDGSTDQQTISILEKLDYPKTSLVTTTNQGLAAARNNGIEAARGEFILPLDADDRIGPNYLKEAVAALDVDPEVGIVYCRAELFGAVEGEWLLPPYSLATMLCDNAIFCSALFRRRDWQLCQGYDPAMEFGWEDYDFWLSLIERGRRVVQLDKIHFYYRVSADSMVRSRQRSQKVATFKKIYLKHQQLFAENIEVWIDSMLDRGEAYHTCRLYLDRGKGLSDQDSLARKIDSGTKRLLFDLSSYKDLVAIRFDPADTQAVVKIVAAELLGAGGESLALTEINSNAFFEDGKTWYFNTKDPQYFFTQATAEKLEQASRLSIELVFVGLGERALEAIINHQQDQLMASVKRPGRAGLLLQRLVSTFKGPRQRDLP